MPDNIERIVQRDLDQLPLPPPERWIPNAKAQARTAPSWLRPLAFVPATLVIVFVALAAGIQLADWRAQREPAAGQTAIAPIPGPLALAGGVPSSGFGLLSSGLNNLLVRNETSEDTLFPIAGGSQAAVSPDGRSIAAWTVAPASGQFSLRVYDTIDKSVGPVLLISQAEQPMQTLWSADGRGIVAMTQTPVRRGGLDLPSQSIHTSWFTVDVQNHDAKPLPEDFARAVSTVHAWDRQRDLITGSGFSGGDGTFTTLAAGRVTTSTLARGTRIGAADSYGRSLVLLSSGICATGAAGCTVLEIRDQASFTTVFSFSPATTPVKEARVVFRPRSQDLIVELIMPSGESRIEVWNDRRSQPRVLASYTAAARFPDLILPRVDGSAAFLLKFDSNPNAPRWFGELVSLSDDSKSAFEIRTGGNPLASVVLDPTFAAALAARSTVADPNANPLPQVAPTPGVATPGVQTPTLPTPARTATPPTAEFFRWPCGTVTAYTAPTATAAGSVSLGTSTFALAPGSGPTNDAPPSLRSSLCVNGDQDANAVFTRFSVSPMGEGICGAVTAYVSASAATPGNLDFGTLKPPVRLPVAPGVTLTAAQVTGDQCFRVTPDTQGTAQVTAYIGPRR